MVAVIIISMMAVFILIVQNGIFHQQLRGNLAQNQAVARNIASSSISLLEKYSDSLEPGFNSGYVTCVYDDKGGFEPEFDRRDLAEELTAWCEKLLPVIPDEIDGEPRAVDIKVGLKIQGKNPDDYTLNSNVCPDILFGSPCYIVPLPGKGDAGERCDLYNPALNGNINFDVPPGLHGRNLDVDQADYSCNWNKLTKGSDLTDRSVVPLYYQNNLNGQDAVLVNPYHAEADLRPGLAEQAVDFTLRLRTPCKCGVPDPETGEVPAGDLDCTAGADATVCSDDQRYQLPENENVIVQWQMTGLCGDDLDTAGECALGGLEDENIRVSTMLTSTKIDTSTASQFVVTNVDMAGLLQPFDQRQQIFEFLGQALSSSFLIYLQEALIDVDGNNIPYLEYQVISESPLVLNKYYLRADVKVGDNSFSEEKEILHEADIIDFAVQN